MPAHVERLPGEPRVRPDPLLDRRVGRQEFGTHLAHDKGCSLQGGACHLQAVKEPDLAGPAGVTYKSHRRVPMARRPVTSFDRFVDEKMKDPAFAEEYRTARAEIDAVDAVVRALDEARERRGLSKADLARSVDMSPEVVRRLFTVRHANPTLDTVVKLANALDFDISLTRRRSPRSRRTATSGR